MPIEATGQTTPAVGTLLKSTGLDDGGAGFDGNDKVPGNEVGEDRVDAVAEGNDNDGDNDIEDDDEDRQIDKS